MTSVSRPPGPIPPLTDYIRITPPLSGPPPRRVVLFLSAWRGRVGGHLPAVAVLAVWAAAGIVLAVRYFRWD